MKRFVLLFLCVACLLCGCRHGGGTLNVHVFSIGQADSILLTDGGASVLIDTGEKDDGGQIADSLSALGIDRIDLLILTHFDKDHIGGAPELLSRVAVDRVLTPAYTPDSKRYKKLLEALDQAGLTAQQLAADTSLSVGGMALDIWTPKAAYAASDAAEQADTDNDQSLVVRLAFGDTRLLLLGDAEDARTEELLGGGYDLACDILKIPHHGRYHATSGALLDAAAPAYALITDSTKNPAETDLIALLDARGIQTMRTMDGDLVLTIQGGRITAAIDR